MDHKEISLAVNEGPFSFYPIGTFIYTPIGYLQFVVLSVRNFDRLI
jgi:hypothetical protein